MTPTKVRLITIGYSTTDNMVNLHVWQEFDSKQKAIDFLNEKRYYPSGLTKEQNKELWGTGVTSVGLDHMFILYPGEQKKWLKTLVKEIL